MGLDWGTVPAWVGSILTGGSLLLGFSILIRDRKEKRQEQATRFLCWLTSELKLHEDAKLPWEVKIRAHNTSEQAMTAVAINIDFNAKARSVVVVPPALLELVELAAKGAAEGPFDTALRFYKSYDVPLEIHDFEAGQQGYRLIRLPAEPARYSIRVTFMDAHGTFYVRELTGRARLREWRPPRTSLGRMLRT